MKLSEKIEEYKSRMLSKYYSKRFAVCGKNFKINGKPLIYGPNKIYIGDNVTINNGVTLAPRGKIYIGNNVVLSRGSQITAGQLDTSQWDLEGTKNKSHVEEDVYIGDGTWLCINSIVLPGVKITGRGVIVAAGAVVCKDCSVDMVVLGGVPAKIVKKL